MQQSLERLCRDHHVGLGDILYIVHSEGWTRIHTLDGEVIQTKIPVKHLFEQLPQEDFLSIQKGTLVSRSHIMEISDSGVYTMVDGEPVFTDYVMNNPDGLSPKEAVGSYSFAQSTGPFVLSSAQTSQLDDASVLEAKEEYIIPFLEESKKYVLPGSLSFTSEQDSERRAAMADIEIYVEEMVMKFITGREPLSNWDTYVNTVKQMGIDNVLSIYQEAVDAWNS